MITEKPKYLLRTKTFILIVGIIFLLGSLSCEKKQEGPLSGTFGSAEELALRFLSALEHESEEELLSLMVTEQEFKEIIWPAYQKIGYGMADQPWFINWVDAEKAVGRALRDYGGEKLKLVKVYFGKGKKDLGSYYIWRDFRMVVKNQGGEEEELDYINTVIEMNGRYKVVAYHT